MKININNYEEWMIDYIEGNLSEMDKKELDEFLEFHPELKSELELFGQTKLTPDNNIVFVNKEILKKHEVAKVVPMRNWVKYSSAIAAALLLFVGINYFNKNTDEPVAIKKYEYQNADEQFAFDRITDSTVENKNEIVADQKQIEKEYADDNKSDKKKQKPDLKIKIEEKIIKQEILELQRDQLERMNPVELAHIKNISSTPQMENREIIQVEKSLPENNLASTNKKDETTNISLNDNETVVDWWNDALAIGGGMENVVTGIMDYEIDPFKKSTGDDKVVKTRSVNIFGISYFSRKKTSN